MTDFNNNIEREFGWDDVIEKDSSGFVQLTPGDYQFTVTNFERARHIPDPQNKNAKLPACNKAIITVEIETTEGIAILTHNLFLHSSTEGMLSAFFGAIGQKKHGEPLKMNWNTVVGAKGVARINKRKGTGQYADKEYDNIKSMIYADEVDWTKVLNANVQSTQHAQPMQQTPNFAPQQPYQQPIQQQAPQQTSFGGF